MVHLLSKSISPRLLAGMLVSVLAFTGLTVGMASPSHASGGGIEIGDGAGTGGGTVPGEPNPVPGGGGSNGGGGGNAPYDPWAPFWETSWGGNPYCANSLVRGASIGVSIQKQRQVAYTANKDTVPAGGLWVDTGTYIPGYGQVWERVVSTENMQCHYPPNSKLVNQMCVIKAEATITQVKPQLKQINSGITLSGYDPNSSDFEGCKNSQSRVDIGASFESYGILEAIAETTVINNTFKVYTEPHPQTGLIPAPELQAKGTPYKLTPKKDAKVWMCGQPVRTATTGDYNHLDWTATSCSSQNTNNSLFECLGSHATVDGFKSNVNTPIQPMRNGTDVVLKFDQSIGGKGVAVAGYDTTFTRTKDSTPYMEDNKATFNSIQLDVLNNNNARIANVLTDGSKGLSTLKYTGNLGTAYFIPFEASDPDGSTVITQNLRWNGTITTASERVVGVVDGKMIMAPTTTTITTNGVCYQSASIQPVKAKSDTIPK